MRSLGTGLRSLSARQSSPTRRASPAQTARARRDAGQRLTPFFFQVAMLALDDVNFLGVFKLASQCSGLVYFNWRAWCVQLLRDSDSRAHFH